MGREGGARRWTPGVPRDTAVMAPCTWMQASSFLTVDPTGGEDLPAPAEFQRHLWVTETPSILERAFPSPAAREGLVEALRSHGLVQAKKGNVRTARQLSRRKHGRKRSKAAQQRDADADRPQVVTLDLNTALGWLYGRSTSRCQGRKRRAVEPPPKPPPLVVAAENEPALQRLLELLRELRAAGLAPLGGLLRIYLEGGSIAADWHCDAAHGEWRLVAVAASEPQARHRVDFRRTSGRGRSTQALPGWAQPRLSLPANGAYLMEPPASGMAALRDGSKMAHRVVPATCVVLSLMLDFVGGGADAWCDAKHEAVCARLDATAAGGAAAASGYAGWTPPPPSAWPTYRGGCRGDPNGAGQRSIKAWHLKHPAGTPEGDAARRQLSVLRAKAWAIQKASPSFDAAANSRLQTKAGLSGAAAVATTLLLRLADLEQGYPFHLRSLDCASARGRKASHGAATFLLTPNQARELGIGGAGAPHKATRMPAREVARDGLAAASVVVKPSVLVEALGLGDENDVALEAELRTESTQRERVQLLELHARWQRRRVQVGGGSGLGPGAHGVGYGAADTPPPMTAAEALALAAEEGLTLLRRHTSPGSENGSPYLHVHFYGHRHHQLQNRATPWVAQVSRGGKSKELGRYATAEEAALVVARSPEGRKAAAEAAGRAAPLTAAEALQQASVAGLTLRRKASVASGYADVERAPSQLKPWSARVSRGRQKRWNLGCYATVEEAALVVARFLVGKRL